MPWYMQNGEQHNILGTRHQEQDANQRTAGAQRLPDWAAELSPQQLKALAPAGSVAEDQSPDARLMGWRPRHAVEIEQGLPQATHGAHGAPKRGRL